MEGGKMSDHLTQSRWDELVTISNAPGYRDVSIRFKFKSDPTEREIRFGPDDVERLARELNAILKCAYGASGGPIDRKGGRVLYPLPEERWHGMDGPTHPNPAAG
jgi:hypothetical protein